MPKVESQVDGAIDQPQELVRCGEKCLDARVGLQQCHQQCHSLLLLLNLPQLPPLPAVSH